MPFYRLDAFFNEILHRVGSEGMPIHQQISNSSVTRLTTRVPLQDRTFTKLLIRWEFWLQVSLEPSNWTFVVGGGGQTRPLCNIKPFQSQSGSFSHSVSDLGEELGFGVIYVLSPIRLVT